MKNMQPLKKSADMILRQVSKSGYATYDGITANAPTNVIDLNKPIQEREFFDHELEYHNDLVELSKRLASIDCSFYGIRDDDAASLLDYMEERDFDCVLDLQVELSEKKKLIKEKTKEMGDLDLNDYMSETDYIRAVGKKRDTIKEIEKKIRYVEMLIETIKEFVNEKNTKQKEFKEENPDWYSLGFANNTSSPDGAAHLR